MSEDKELASEEITKEISEAEKYKDEANKYFKSMTQMCIQYEINYYLCCDNLSYVLLLYAFFFLKC